MDFHENELELVNIEKVAIGTSKQTAMIYQRALYRLEAVEMYKPKLDDVANVFLQSFSVFLDKYSNGNNKNVAGNPIRLRKRKR